MVTLPQKEIPLVTLQKILFLCKDRIRTCDINYTFQKSHFGPYSQEIVADVEELQQKGFVKMEKGNRLFVTKNISAEERWANAEPTIAEFNRKFPDNHSIVMSALSSPNVINKAVGEPIATSH
jgi:uncharacterized protein YwgA